MPAIRLVNIDDAEIAMLAFFALGGWHGDGECAVAITEIANRMNGGDE